jgi:D-alanyl-D-alanine carboxypeptidase (penicillin-binding protein 5/6)
MNVSLLQKLQLRIIYTLIDGLVLIESPALLPRLLLRRTSYLILILLLSTFIYRINIYKKNISYIAEYFFYVPYSSVLQTIPANKIPRQLAAIPFPDVSAQGILVADLKSGHILFERNKNMKFPPASTTKVMTALVAEDLFSKEATFTVDYNCTQIPSQKAGFVVGEVLDLSELIKSLLIASAGDAACVLSQTHSPVSFVTRMNLLAKSIGMNDTKFSNAIGLDDFENGQESTPYDLYLLTKKALEDDFIVATVKTKELDIESLETSSSAKVTHHLINTNRLLWEIPETIGFKTGRTDGAGEVLVYVYSKDEKAIAIIVMKSLDRFEDTKKILDWTLSSFAWE